MENKITDTLDNSKIITELSKENSVCHYFTSTPFSNLGNANYNKNLTPEFFRKHFYVETPQLIEMKQELYAFLKSNSKNIAFITGYQGCGKTTYTNYAIDDACKEFTKQNYNCSVVKFDFEISPPSADSSPFHYHISKKVRKMVTSLLKRDDKIIKFILNNYQYNASIFDDLEKSTEISKYFSFLTKVHTKQLLIDSEENKELHISFLDNLNCMQLLCILCYFFVCENAFLGNNPEMYKKIFFFDNIDNIQQSKYISGFIQMIKSFIENGANFFSSLKFKNNIDYNYNLFSNFNFIFCLRDTTVAEFSAHFVSRALDFFHRDISDKGDPGLFSEKKSKFLRDNDFINKTLNKDSEIINIITTERRTIKYIFPLFNSDYRTVMKSLEMLDLSSNNKSLGRDFSVLIKYDNPVAKFGAHGILFRLLLDLFESRHYFADIGTLNEDYSIPRVVLTYLRNYQETHVDNFLDNDQHSSLDLKKFYDDFYKIVDMGVISDKLCEMYNLSTRKYWNHLICFDCQYPVEVGNLISIFDKYKNNQGFKYGDGRIRITCAGRIFSQRVCSHFEYFSCRYIKNSLPLFAYENSKELQNDVKNQGYKCIQLIDNVYAQVEKCCETTAKFDKKIAEKYYNNNMNEYLKSHYVYNRSQTHIERLINYHISYIDAYRLYIIENGQDKNKDDICQKLCICIKKYVTLLEKYGKEGLVSDHAKELYTDKYLPQIKIIEDKYKNKEPLSLIPISWDYPNVKI